MANRAPAVAVLCLVCNFSQGFVVAAVIDLIFFVCVALVEGDSHHGAMRHDSWKRHGKGVS